MDQIKELRKAGGEICELLERVAHLADEAILQCDLTQNPECAPLFQRITVVSLEAQLAAFKMYLAIGRPDAARLILAQRPEHV